MADEGRFRALYDASHARLLSLLIRMAGRQEAEDLAQIAYAKAAAAWPGFREDADPATWLYRIAVNVAVDHLRSRAAREAKLTEALPGDDLCSNSAAMDPEQELARKDVQASLLTDIGRLSETHREALLLSARAGMNDDEIARMLDISKGAVKVRLHRARQEFRQIVGANCEFYRNEFACQPSTPDCCTSTDKNSGC